MNTQTKTELKTNTADRETTTETIESLYLLSQQLVQLCLKHIQLPGTDPKEPIPVAKTLVMLANKIADGLIRQYYQHPARVIAQTTFYLPHYGYLINQMLNKGILATIITQKSQWHPRPQRSVVAAAILSQACALKAIHKQANELGLTPAEQKVLKSANTCTARLLQYKGIDQLFVQAISGNRPGGAHLKSKEAITIVDLCVRLTRLITPSRHQKALPPAMAIKKLALINTPAYFMTWLDHLAHIFTAHYDGSLVKLLYKSNKAKSKTDEGPEVRLVLLMAPVDIEPQDIILDEDTPETERPEEPVRGHVGYMLEDYKMSPDGEFICVNPSDIIQVLPPKACRHERVYSTIWDHALMAYRAQFPAISTSIPRVNPVTVLQPPPAVTGLIKELASESPDVGTLCEHIDTSTYLQTLIASFASQKSRQDLEVKDTRHSLMMLGMERVGPLVIQEAINEKLLQLSFPGIHCLQQIHRCFLNCVRELGNHNDLSHPEEVALIAHVLIAPVYLNQDLQLNAWNTAQLFRPCPADSPLKRPVEQLFHIPFNEKHMTIVQKLARSWMLPSYSLEVFKLLVGDTPDKNTTKKVVMAQAVIAGATEVALCLLQQGTAGIPNTQKQLSVVAKRLKLSDKKLQAIFDQCLIEYHPMIPLY